MHRGAVVTLEEVWELREEVVYPSLFGPVGRGIFPLTSDLFGQYAADPRWLTYGVLEFPPTADRASWLYVTSGHSNPWETEPEDFDPKGESGAGVEFMLCVSEQGDWAVRALQKLLALDLLLGSGRVPGGPFGAGHRIPIGGTLDGTADCLLTTMMVIDPTDLPAGFNLPSGEVILAAFAAISGSELAFAKEHGSDVLAERLMKAGALPVNNPRRASIV